jgi:Na+-driven multidrug efflux pump
VVLAIHGLAALPYLHGELRGAVLVIEKKTVWSVRCALVGLLLNVLLNLWLVPAHGAAGAAWATAVAYLLVWFVSSLVLPSLRSIGWQQLSALLAPFRLRRELAAIKALTA